MEVWDFRPSKILFNSAVAAEGESCFDSVPKTVANYMAARNHASGAYSEFLPFVC